MLPTPKFKQIREYYTELKQIKAQIHKIHELPKLPELRRFWHLVTCNSRVTL